MRIAKYVLAAAALASAAALPAHADPTFETGFNNGDAGVISVSVNSGLAGTRSTGGPTDGVLDAKCTFEQVNTPNNGVTALVIAGSATAGPRGTARALSTDLRCRIVNAFTGTVVYDKTIGNESAVAVHVPVPVTTVSASWTVCTEVHAHYSDGAFVTTEKLHCIAPF